METVLPNEPEEELPKSVVTERSGTFKEVIMMALPLMISFLSFSLMSMFDAWILGRVGTPEQGGVLLAGMLLWGTASLFTGTFNAIITLVAQDYGAGRYANIRRHACTGFSMVPPFAALVVATMPLFPPALELFGTDASVRPHVVTYVDIVLWGTPLFFTNFVIVSFLRGLGNMRTPMIITVIANLINVGLDIVLVFGYLGFPAMGVSGAALASVIARFTETCMYLGVYFHASYHVKYRTRSWLKPTLDDYRRFLKLGLPIGLTWIFDMVSWTFFSIYASRLRPADLSAHMIIFQIIHICFLPAVAVSVSGTTLVGQYLGAKRPDLAKASALKSLWFALAYMSLAGLVMAIARVPLVTFFNPDPEVVAVGTTLVLIAAVFQPFDAIGIVLSGVLRGAGDTRFPMIVFATCGAVVFIPGVLLMGEWMGEGIVGAWKAAVVYIFVVAVAHVVRYAQGKWTEIELETY